MTLKNRKLCFRINGVVTVNRKLLFLFPTSYLSFDTESLPTSNQYSYLLMATLQLPLSLAALTVTYPVTYPSSRGWRSLFIMAGTPAHCSAIWGTWVDQCLILFLMCPSLPMMYLVYPGLRLVFRSPQYTLQMALQTASAMEKQVNIMNQGGNWRTVLCTLIMISDARDSKLLVKR